MKYGTSGQLVQVIHHPTFELFSLLLMTQDHRNIVRGEKCLLNSFEKNDLNHHLQKPNQKTGIYNTPFGLFNKNLN